MNQKQTPGAFRQNLIGGAIASATAAILIASGHVLAAAANPATNEKTFSLVVGQTRTALSAFADVITYSKTQEIAEGDAYAPVDHTLLTQDVIDSLGEHGLAKHGTMRLVKPFLSKEGELTFLRMEEITNVAIGKVAIALDEFGTVDKGDKVAILAVSMKLSHAVASMMADLTATSTLIAQADLMANGWSFVPLTAAEGVMTTVNLVGGVPETQVPRNHDINSQGQTDVGTTAAGKLAATA